MPYEKSTSKVATLAPRSCTHLQKDETAPDSGAAGDIAFFFVMGAGLAGMWTLTTAIVFHLF